MYRQLSFDKFGQYQTKTAYQTGSTRPTKTDPAAQIFFADGKRKIDYVLVFCQNDLDKDEQKSKLMFNFLKSVKLCGLQMEQENGNILDALVCIKLHAPKAVLDAYVDSFQMELSKNNPNYKYHRQIPLKCMRNIVTCPDMENEILQRAVDTFSGKQPTDYTNAERIYIVHQLLSQLNFLDNDEDITGFEWLISEKVLLACYPLHDSSYEWTKEGPLSDRQILARYWANFSSFFKEQPLSLIERYYGPAVAFYFAWVEFYTVMLLPAAILSLLCFIGGIFYLKFFTGTIVDEVCNSDQVLCPMYATVDQDFHNFEPVKRSCIMVIIANALDNPVTAVYAILMSFWGVIFMIMWQRKQAQLNLRWNLSKMALESELRPKYKKKARLKRVSSITGHLEYYVPLKQKILRKLVSYFVLFLMVLLYALGVMAVLYFRLNFNYCGSHSTDSFFKKWHFAIEPWIAASITCAFIIIFNLFNYKLSYFLTEFENPRTQGKFERDCARKFVALYFANVFFPVFYIAFIKGYYFTHPGDPARWPILSLFKEDTCRLRGCLLDLAITMFIIMVMKNPCRIFLEHMIPKISVYCKRRKADTSSATRWEEDFVLVHPGPRYLYSEFISLTVQYGFMTFFLVAFPIAPIVALINNLVELRLDAMKIIKHHRRPVMRKTAGIGEWNQVLKFITLFGTVSNSFLIAFSSRLIGRYIYLFNIGSLKGYVNSTLSEFLVSDYPGDTHSNTNYNATKCYYIGRRYPPSHPEKYQHTRDFWYHLAVRTIFFAVLENVCLYVAFFFKRLIPKLPIKVQLRRAYEERILREERLLNKIKPQNS